MNCKPPSLFPCAAGGEEVEKIRNEVEPRKKGGVREGGVFNDLFLISHFPSPDW